MKTRFSHRTSNRSPVRTLATIAAVVILVILFILRLAFPGALVVLAAPFFSLGTYLSGVIALPQNSATLAANDAALQAKNQALAEENATLAKRLADLGASKKGGGVIAGVTARPPQSPYDALVVGAGTDDGVYVGMRAEANGIPVGTVESASGGSARVALYSAPGRDTEGWVGSKNVPVTLHGEGGGSFSADIPKDAQIVEGDAVYLPGPGAVPAGTITKIVTDASSPRATLRIRPAANPFTLTWVSLMPSPAP